MCLGSICCQQLGADQTRTDENRDAYALHSASAKPQTSARLHGKADGNPLVQFLVYNYITFSSLQEAVMSTESISALVAKYSNPETFREPLAHNDPIFWASHSVSCALGPEIMDRLGYEFGRARQHAEAKWKKEKEEREKRRQISRARGIAWEAAVAARDAEIEAMKAAGRGEEAKAIDWGPRILDRMPSPMQRTSGMWDEEYQAQRDARKQNPGPLTTPPPLAPRNPMHSRRTKRVKDSNIQKHQQRRPATRSRADIAHISLHDKRGMLVLEDQGRRILSRQEWNNRDSNPPPATI